VAGGCRSQHNEELHKSPSTPHIIRVIKSRGMILTVHVTHILNF